VRAYLSVEHRDNPGDGCPSAALLDEISRCADATKQAYTDGVLAVIDDIATRLDPGRSTVCPRPGAQCLRIDDRDGSALALARGPVAGRCGP
jgi:hypothetical protein